MSFIDLNKNDIPHTPYDYTIIGAGAAGLLLGIKLSRKGYKVQIIESGHFEVDEFHQSLNEIEFSNSNIHSSATWGRKRAIGGTTVAWGGQSLPFFPIDLQKRDWVPLSGWPIDYNEVSSFYREANEFMKIDNTGYGKEALEKIYASDPFSNHTEFLYHVSKWANRPNFYALYKKEIEKNIDVVFNANLIKMNIQNTLVKSIEVANYNKKKFEVAVNVLVVAAGGIETVRIMLLNQCSRSAWLGKCFMEHPCIEVGEIKTKKLFHLQRAFNTHIYKGKKYSIRLSLSENAQQKEKLLNCSASILFKPANDVFDPYAELKAFKKDFNIKRLIRLSTSLFSFTKSLYALLQWRFFFKENAEAKIALMAEQEPTLNSCIVLGEETDMFFQKKARIQWEISPLTWETIVFTASKLKELFESYLDVSVNLYQNIKAENANYEKELSAVNHHMGGTKMSTTPEQGVVDVNLRVWDISNLFLCSSSVFPTSSHSNPTLTLLALTCRLAVFLSNQQWDKQ